MTNKSFVPSVDMNKQGTFCSEGKRINWEKKGTIKKKSLKETMMRNHQWCLPSFEYVRSPV